MHRALRCCVLVFAVAFFGTALCTMPALGERLKVGEVYPVDIDTPEDYEGVSGDEPEVEWSYRLSHPGATYIAIHFVDFELGEGDYLVVSDPQGGQRYTLAAKGKMEAGTFWAQHVKGDTAIMELVKTGSAGGKGFQIDQYGAGYLDLDDAFEPGARAICGVDDKENAICYESSHPADYQHGRPVARLLIVGSWLCTGWLLSPDDHLITCEHCITSSYQALNTDYEFMSEAPNCTDHNCQLCYPGTVFSGATFVRDSYNLDYCLVHIASGSPADTYGYLEIDNRVAEVGEQIYIPQHPGGRAKEYAIFSTHPSDVGGVCRVYSITEPACHGSGYYDVGYYADTETGSSGSPVMPTSSHRAIALHHCGTCPNRGVPINLIYPEISSYLAPLGPHTEITSGPSGTISYSDVAFTWTGTDNLTDTEDLVYSYMLEGYDTSWGSWTAETSASYQALPDGEYTFKVKCQDEVGHEDPTPATRSFVVWTVYVVQPDGLGQFPTIQAAIDAAVDGIVVELTDGTFTGVGNRNIDYQGKVITVRSQSGNPDVCVMDCEGLGRGFYFHSGEGPQSVLKDITITGGWVTTGSGLDGYGGGVCCASSSPTIENCIFTGNDAHYDGGGIYCDSSSPQIVNCVFEADSANVGGAVALRETSNATLTECVFSGNAAGLAGGAFFCAESHPALSGCRFSANRVDGSGGALSVREASEATLEGCVIVDNTADANGGALDVRVWEASVDLTNCTIAGNSAPYYGSQIWIGKVCTVTLDNSIIAFGTGAWPVECGEDAHAYLACCDVYGNSGGDYIACIAGQGGVNDNFRADPLFCSAQNPDEPYTLRGDSPCAPGNNVECGLVGALGVGCWLTVHVPGDYPTIQGGIDAAGSGYAVEVAPGTYYEHEIAMKSGVWLHSATCQPECVTIDAQGQGRVLRCEDVDNTAKIEGFTLTGGHAMSGTWPEGFGGGMLCNASSPTIENCIFSDNVAVYDGGGLYCYDSSPKIENCTFSGDSASAGGAISMREYSDPSITDCCFTGNASHLAGGALYCSHSSPVVEGCTFSGNRVDFSGGALSCRENSQATFTRCVVVENAAGRHGGGLDCRAYGEPVFLNCTLANNSSGHDEGYESGTVWCGTYGDVTLENTIIAFDTHGDAVSCDETATVTLACCDLYGNAQGDWDEACVAGQYGTNGNISEDPFFCDYMNPSEPYALHSSSPCAAENNPQCGLVGALGVGCSARIIHVPGDYEWIQAAIDAAVAGDIVEVAAGTYNEFDIAMKSGVWLRSETGEPDCVTIDAEGHGKVFYCNGVDAAAKIEGFTITGAHSNDGGAMFCTASSLSVTKCVFTGNSASGSGAALDCKNGSAPTITECTFSGNTAEGYGGGIYSHENAAPEIDSCTFEENLAGSDGGAIYCTASSPTITNCTFSADSANVGGAVSLRSDSNPTITNCKFLDNGSEIAGGGLYCSDSSPGITGCTFSGNTTKFSGGAMGSRDGADPTVSTCVFVENMAGVHGGVLDCRNGGAATFNHCTFSDNASGTKPGEDCGCIWCGATGNVALENTIITFSTEGNAVSCEDAGCAVSLMCCDLYGNAGGDWNEECIAGQYGVNGNISEDPLFCGDLNPEEPYSLQDESPCAPGGTPGCDLIGALGVGCSTTQVWHVPGDFPTVQGAINAASPGEVVEVACGTYYEFDIIMKSGVVVRSETGQPDCATIDAGGQGRVFYCYNVDSEAGIEGFTITGGSEPSSDGGGMYCRYSSLEAKNCVFTGNSANVGGGVCLRKLSDATITDCQFLDNSGGLAGGGLYCAGSTPSLTGCTFSGNTVDYSGGGLGCREWSSPTVTGCLFVGNTADRYGGGVDCRTFASPTFVHCTFSENAGALGGGGLWVSNNASVTLENAIVAFSTEGMAVDCDGTSSAALSCCDVYGNSGGDWVDCISGQGGINDNFSADPLFCGGLNPDEPYTLHSNSPCTAENNPVCGLVGALDVGCGRGEQTAVDEAAGIPTVFSLLPNVPNPFNPVTEITYTIPAGSEPSRVVLTVYNTLGQKVQGLVDRPQPAGIYTVVWDGKDEHGVSVASGVYFCRLSWSGRSETRRMVLVK